MTSSAPPDPVRTHDEPLGQVAWLAGSGVVVALGILAALVAGSRPVRDAFAVLRDDGAVAAVAPAESDPSLATPEARASAVRRVRAELLPVYRADKAALDAVLERDRRGNLRRGVERLQGWARLRESWARALARAGLSPADYRLAARSAPPEGPDAPEGRALDALLGVEAASPTLTPTGRP